MTKIARTFTVDSEIYERAKATLPNMSLAVEAGLRDAVSNQEEDQPENPMKGVSRRLLNRAVNLMARPPRDPTGEGSLSREQLADRQTEIINHACGTKLKPVQLISYYQTMDVIR